MNYYKTKNQKQNYMFYGIVALIIVIFSVVMYNLYSSNDEDFRNITKSVSIDKSDLLKHELKTNEGFKVVLTGNCQALNPIQDAQYLKADKKFLYLRQVTERYTKHTSTTTDSKGRTKTRTYYSWDYYRDNLNKVNNISVLNHEFKNISLNFRDSKTLELKDLVNSNIKNKVSGNYIYLNGRFISLVGDKRIYFEGVYDNSYMSLTGEIKEKTIKPYIKYKEVLVFDGNKKAIIDKLNKNRKLFGIVYIAGLLIIIGAGYFIKKYYY